MLTHFVSDKIVKLVIMPNYDTSFSILSKAEYMSIYYLFRRDHESSGLRMLTVNNKICQKNREQAGGMVQRFKHQNRGTKVSYRNHNKYRDASMTEIRTVIYAVICLPNNNSHGLITSKSILAKRNLIIPRL